MRGIAFAILFGVLSSVLLGEVAVRILACWSSEVAFLAHAGSSNARPVATSLREFVSYPGFQMRPHVDFYGYATNALGFMDTEFELPKPEGRKRILAVGDSFVRGTVPYPRNVMTVLEEKLRATCSRTDFDLLNLGVSGAGPWEYNELVRLVAKPFGADMVLLHFYFGNDGPDVLHEKDTLPRSKPFAIDSLLYRYINNAITLLRATPEVGASLEAGLSHSGSQFRGGEKTTSAPELTDRARAFRKPTIWGEAWRSIQWDELKHFFNPKNDAEKLSRSWQNVLTQLREIHSFLRKENIEFAIVFYPSELQVEPAKRASAFENSSKRNSKRKIDPADYDFLLPNQTLLKFCQREGIRCFDVTQPLSASCETSGMSCYIPQNTHWNLLGNRLAAEIEASFLAPLICPPEQS